MRKIHSPNIKWLGLLAAASLLSGCANTGGGSETPSGKIRITSEPAGAIAYADGTELGATPLSIIPGNHFRSGFAGLSYRYVGKLSIKKAGCDTWTTDVNDAILAKDIHAKLKCGPNYQSATPVASTPADAVTGNQSIERLERIEALRKKGLISDEEYKQLRTRILDKL